ncbi:uncharacterized protein LY89DRAFT_662531 [Mollisia scopiformis]|uniref:Uncharacterized protein n=1 Tax=Mollisia scopiformis TaxID=149040 RepID=A0A194XU38_MOLSC|nr:uncharacterized protein LY89DRAFT_662531 [Mollisia scopiformis]KUJ23723.1 hypothetical protein LY89DRAFT_662531 [Mollisia scopiformis]
MSKYGQMISEERSDHLNQQLARQGVEEYVLRRGNWPRQLLESVSRPTRSSPYTGIPSNHEHCIVQDEVCTQNLDLIKGIWNDSNKDDFDMRELQERNEESGFGYTSYNADTFPSFVHNENNHDIIANERWRTPADLPRIAARELVDGMIDIFLPLEENGVKVNDPEELARRRDYFLPRDGENGRLESQVLIEHLSGVRAATKMPSEPAQTLVMDGFGVLHWRFPC